jgi:NADH:ubiquinone oxidoreductase subunit 3 (subunit A)
MTGSWPSGWNVYYVVVLAGLLALLIPAALLVISRTLSHRSVEPVVSVPLIISDNPAEIGTKTNPRIFQAINAALVLIVLALLMIPCAVILPGISGLICILSFCLIAGLALLYGVRKRDLDWSRTFRGMD